MEHSFKHDISFKALYRAFAPASEGVEQKIPGNIDPWDKERGE
jgi:hypothetical protein